MADKYLVCSARIVGQLTRQGLPSGPKTIPGGSFVVLPLASALTIFVSGVQRVRKVARVRLLRAF